MEYEEGGKGGEEAVAFTLSEELLGVYAVVLR